jgi:hypothetical protein
MVPWSFQALVVVQSKKICCGVETAGYATPHIAVGTRFSIENKEKSTLGGTTCTSQGATLVPFNLSKYNV